MGEIADDMIDGTCCSLCGCYFMSYEDRKGKVHLFTHGYPVACKDCWTPDCGYPEAEVETM